MLSFLSRPEVALPCDGTGPGSDFLTKFVARWFSLGPGTAASSIEATDAELGSFRRAALSSAKGIQFGIIAPVLPKRLDQRASVWRLKQSGILRERLARAGGRCQGFPAAGSQQLAASEAGRLARFFDYSNRSQKVSNARLALFALLTV